MSRISTWLAPLVIGAAAAGATLLPAPARAQSAGDLIRVLVDATDVIYRSGTPYYRYGNYGSNDRLIVGRDRYGRPVYYRNTYRNAPPYGVAHGYHRNRGYAHPSRTRCDSRGRCTTTYYDARQDRRGYYDNRYYDNRYSDNRYYGSRYGDNGRHWGDDD